MAQGEAQLRIYRLCEGELDEFVDKWRQHVVPVRRSFGFDVLAAWISRERREFVWVVGHDGPGSIEEHERAYQASPESGTIREIVASHVADSELRQLTPVSIPTPA